MKNDDESLLLARFLIEDNDNLYINFDLQTSRNIHIIKSIFKNIVGNYTLYTTEEVDNFLAYFKIFFQVNYTFLNEALKKFLPNKRKKKKQIPIGF